MNTRHHPFLYQSALFRDHGSSPTSSALVLAKSTNSTSATVTTWPLFATVLVGHMISPCFRALSGPLQGVGDDCPVRAMEPPVLHPPMTLRSISSPSEPLHTYLTHPLLYIASYHFTPGLCHRHGNFLALGYEIYACSGLLSSASDDPTTIYTLCGPLCVHVTRVFREWDNLHIDPLIIKILPATRSIQA